MSTIANLLARTQAAALRREQAAKAEYDQLVDSAARGADLDPETLGNWLNENGFEVSRFTADVQHRAARRSAAATLSARSSAERKLATANAALANLTANHDQKVAAARAKFEAEVARFTGDFEAATAPHLGDKATAERALSNADTAAQHLIDTAPAELKAEVATLHAQIAAAEARVARLTAKLKESEIFARDGRADLISAAEARGARTFRDEANRGGSAMDAQHRAKQNGERFIREDLERVERHLQEQRDVIQGERRRIAELHAEIERIEDRMLIV